MNSKIVLIDGHSILNRAFYGLPDLIQCRRASYECNLRLSDDYVQDIRRRKAGLFDGCL